MGTYNVPLEINGEAVYIPVDGVDDEAAATAAVQAALDAGEIDLDVFTPDTQGYMRGAGPVGTAAEIAAGVVEGMAQTVRKAEEWGLMVNSALIPDDRFPEQAMKARQARADAREKNKEARRVDRNNFRAAFGDDAEFSAGAELLGEGIMFAPLAGQAQGLTMTRAVISNMVEGGVTAGISVADQAKSIDETLGTTAIGTLFGLGMSVFQTLKGIRAFAGRKLGEELNTTRGKAMLRMEEEISERTGKPFTFTVAQLAVDNPWLTGLEMGAAERQFLRKQNENTQTVIDLLLRRGDSADDAGEFIADLGGAVNKKLIDLKGTATDIYQKGIDDIVANHGGKVFFDAENYLTNMNKYIAGLDDPRKLGTAATKQLRDHADVVNGMINQQGGFTPEDVLAVLHGHNEMLRSLRSLGKTAPAGSAGEAGKVLKSSMMESLDATEGQAAKDIKKLQSSYAFESERIRVIEAEALAAIFGGTDDQVRKTIANPEEALKALSEMQPSAFFKAENLLRTIDGGDQLIKDMKRLVMTRWVANSADDATAIGLHNTDVNKLIRNLSGVGEVVTDTVGQRGRGLFLQWEQDEIKMAAQALQTLKTTFKTSIAKDAAGIAADTIINTISRNAGFMARYIVRNVTNSGNMERLMLDPKARKSLIELGKRGPGSTGGRIAIAYLSTMLGAWQAEDEEIADRKKAREMNARGIQGVE